MPPTHPPRLIRLNIWPLAGGAVLGACGTLGGKDGLEEVSHPGRPCWGPGTPPLPVPFLFPVLLRYNYVLQHDFLP